METRLEILNDLTAGLYHQFLLGLSIAPEFEEECWSLLHKFYHDCYIRYANEIGNNEKLMLAQSSHLKGFMYVNKTSRPVNLRRFLDEIKNNEIISTYYLTKI